MGGKVVVDGEAEEGRERAGGSAGGSSGVNAAGYTRDVVCVCGVQRTSLPCPGCSLWDER